MYARPHNVCVYVFCAEWCLQKTNIWDWQRQELAAFIQNSDADVKICINPDFFVLFREPVTLRIKIIHVWHLCFAFYVFYTSYFPLYDRCNNNRLKVKITRLLVINSFTCLLFYTKTFSSATPHIAPSIYYDADVIDHTHTHTHIPHTHTPHTPHTHTTHTHTNTPHTHRTPTHSHTSHTHTHIQV